MENKELKQPIPVELNEEELNMVAGGGNVIQSVAVSEGPSQVDLRQAKEGENCRHCGIAFEKGETVYMVNCVLHNIYCENCCKKLRIWATNGYTGG